MPAKPSVHTTDMFQDLLALDVVDLSAQLTILLMNNDRYKKFVACHADAAQPLLDFLQARLDYPIAAKFKSRHVRALVKLSERSGRYPECLVLDQVTLPTESVASGSFGDVYKCEMAGRDVAVKVLKVSKKTIVEELLKSFAREAVLWRQLSHPNVLPFYGAFRLGFEQRKLCMVCPWMSNEDLSTYLESEDLPRGIHVLFALDVAKGLAYLHSEQVIHADLKSMNILVSHAPRARLSDFGLSSASGTGSIMSTIKPTGLVGTVRWMGPELFPPKSTNPDESESEEEARQPDKRSDVYSFAMVCYEIFSGYMPFADKKSDKSVTRALRRGERPQRPLNGPPRGMTDEMWKIMVNCWGQFPEDRMTADEAVERLCGLPDLPLDDRPHEDHTIPFLSRTMYKEARHPFSILESIAEQVTERELDSHDVGFPSAGSLTPPSGFARSGGTSRPAESQFRTGSRPSTVSLSGAGPPLPATSPLVAQVPERLPAAGQLIRFDPGILRAQPTFGTSTSPGGPEIDASRPWHDSRASRKKKRRQAAELSTQTEDNLQQEMANLARRIDVIFREGLEGQSDADFSPASRSGDEFGSV
ncbi:hypothetical protein HWV62_11930 [Athelia sp. TMB]|nr:hypothetical protein HWV62_11930 [Athelia sp. TMB]